MNRRQINYWYNVYRTSLRWFGVETKELKRPTQASINKLKEEWKKQTKGLTDFPSVREIYNQQTQYEKEQASFNDTPRDANFRTPDPQHMHDFALDVINDFIYKIETIYQDTLTQIDMALNEIEGVSKTIAIASHHTDRIARAKQEIIDFINKMLQDTNNNPEKVAEAIMRNGELDYVVAVSLIPPSDIQVEFELTLQNLQAIWTQVIAEVTAEAEQNLE